MKRINSREVELTDREMKASDHFSTYLDNGANIRQAADAIRIIYPDLDPDFFAWLEN